MEDISQHNSLNLSDIRPTQKYRQAFCWGTRTYLMGILNATPDSFSDGGLHNNISDALLRVRAMLDQGADIIDVGGESTRPSYTPVSATEEANRVIPIIAAIKNAFPDVPVSIDTMKAEVAKKAIAEGATMLNDVWGFRRDAQLAELTASTGVYCCLMHNRDKAVYSNVLEEVCEDLLESVSIALAAGVKKDRIILDPGIGFGKTLEHNLDILCKLERICELGYPVLLGASRKSVIGLTLGLPIDDRLEGTLAISALAALKGVSMLRVHDVKENFRVLKMTDAIKSRNSKSRKDTQNTYSSKDTQNTYSSKDTQNTYSSKDTQNSMTSKNTQTN